MEGLLYLVDVVCVIWLLVLVRRNDGTVEASNRGQLGIFSMVDTPSKTEGDHNAQRNS